MYSTTLAAVPATRASQNIAARFRKHGHAYFEYVTTPGVEPTNNLAQQAIRFVVIDRRITQGTRGEKGRRWCERIWTIIATCSQQGPSVFAYLSAGCIPKKWCAFAGFPLGYRTAVD
jgi:Transposase IS66 family